jgi:hypothetical protein
MTKDEALRLALEALYGFIPYLPLEHDKPQCDRYDQTITAIKTALEAKDEPVAIFKTDLDGGYVDLLVFQGQPLSDNTLLYTTPPQRTWVGLTEAECGVLWKVDMTPFDYYQAIEAKLKAKNS